MFQFIFFFLQRILRYSVSVDVRNKMDTRNFIER